MRKASFLQHPLLGQSQYLTLSQVLESPNDVNDMYLYQVLGEQQHYK